MGLAYSKDPDVDRSLRHSVRDAAAYSVMSGGGESYIAAFALFLRASSTQIAVLASLPQLLGSFAQLISAQMGRRIGGRKRLILIGAAGQAVIWLPLLILPLLFPDHAPLLIIVCVTLYYAMGNLAVPLWSSLMGDLVPERRRGRFFARRTRIASVVSFTALVAGGLILHYFDNLGMTLAGYAFIFGTALGARIISVYHLTQMHDPPHHCASFESLSVGAWIQRLRRSRFAQFSFFFAAMQFSVAIASPFFVVYMLRDLQFSYLQFMVNTAASVFVQFLTLNMWGRIGDAFGNRLILVTTGLIIPFLPGLWLLSTDFWYLMALQAVGGMAWAGFSLSAGNFLYDLVPGEKRITYLALHNVLAGIGIFAGALLGGYLVNTLPTRFTVGGFTIDWFSVFYWVFLASSLARLAVAVIFLPRLREVRSVRAATLADIVFRVPRFHPLSWLNFDILSLRKRPPAKATGIADKRG